MLSRTKAVRQRSVWPMPVREKQLTGCSAPQHRSPCIRKTTSVVENNGCMQADREE